MTLSGLDTFFDDHLATSRVMVILRGYGAPRTIQLCQRAWDLGINLVEVPVQSADDLAALAAAVAAARARGRSVGAGTVVSPHLVEQVADAGAAFTVAPGVDEAVAKASRRRGMAHLPGVATATEIQHALRLGFVWQKAFPASILGPEWIHAVRGPFPQVQLVATGGVDLLNARQFLAAGCGAVSLGSSFADAAQEQVRELLVAD